MCTCICPIIYCKLYHASLSLFAYITSYTIILAILSARQQQELTSTTTDNNTTTPVVPGTLISKEALDRLIAGKFEIKVT